MVAGAYTPTGKENHTILYCRGCGWYSDYGPLQIMSVPYSCHGYCGKRCTHFLRYGPGEKEKAYDILYKEIR